MYQEVQSSGKMKPQTIPNDKLFGAQSLQLALTACNFSCLRLACYITATCPRLDTKYAGSAFFLQHLQLLAERHFRGAPFLFFFVIFYISLVIFWHKKTNNCTTCISILKSSNLTKLNRCKTAKHRGLSQQED